MLYHTFKCIILCLFIIIVCSSPTSYPIGDARYDIDYCNSSTSASFHVKNQFGILHVTNNIIATQLTFHIEWLNNTVYPSCYLCQLSRMYCHPSSFQFADDSDISMARQLMHNFMVVLVKENEHFPHNIPLSSQDYQFSMISENNSITLNVSDISYSLKGIKCGDTVKLVIIPLITLNVPSKKDIVTIVYQKDDFKGQYISCSSSSARLYEMIDCSVIRKIYYVKYTFNNCFEPNKGTITSPTLKEDPIPSISALSWYLKIVDFVYTYDSDGNLKRLLFQIDSSSSSSSSSSLPMKRRSMMNNNDSTPTASTMATTMQALLIIDKMKNVHICGKMWYDILMNSRIEQLKCNEVAMLYFDMKPYVRLSLQTVTAHLNLIMKQGKLSNSSIGILNDLFISYDVLSRQCSHLNDEYRRNETIYNTLITRFENFNRESDEITSTICVLLMKYVKERQQQAPSSPVVKGNHTSSSTTNNQPPLPYPIYLYQYPRWFFQMFSFLILYYSGDMELGSIILLTFIVSCLVFLLCTLICICHLGCKMVKGDRAYFLTKTESSDQVKID